MSFEHYLSKKNYFQSLVSQDKSGEPVAALGEMFLEENKKDVADLSYIRFAQGEVYFHNKDYETAIFKWENISNELEAWAKKNVADAYYELGLTSAAVETLVAIKADNIILQTEIAIKLFDIYLREGKFDKAVQYIKKAVSIHPDYDNITEVARVFFEDKQDDANAMELAVNETIRTKKSYWFDVLTGYAEAGMMRQTPPEYFMEALRSIYYTDSQRFEKLSALMWEAYGPTPLYKKWLEMFNEFLQQVDSKQSDSWSKLSKLYEAAFFDAVSGGFKLKELLGFMPKFLENWVSIARPGQAVSACSAILAWNEYYPSSLSQERVAEAGTMLAECRSAGNVLKDSLALFDSIAEWAEGHNIEVDAKIQWFVGEILDMSKQNVLLTGVNGTGKTSFLNSVLGEDLLQEATGNVFRLKNGDEPRITVISEEGSYTETEMGDLVQTVNHDIQLHSRAIMDIEFPSTILDTYGLAVIDTPGLRGRRDRLAVAEFFPLADHILFVLDAEDPFTEQERDILIQILDQAPGLPISFVITKLDTIYNKQEAKRIVEDAYARIQAYMPDARVIAYSSKYEVAGQDRDVRELFKEIAQRAQQKENRTKKLLQMVKRTISFLIEKRVEKENAYIDSIKWNKDVVSKLNASILQMGDYEKERAAAIRDAYAAIKEEVKAEAEVRLPEILRGCSSLVTETSDYRKIHLHINEEMNRRMQSFFDEEILPKYYANLENWLKDAKVELIQSKQYLDEMSETFNNLYGEEKIKLKGDFKVLEDWQRDINRMTIGTTIEQENIFLRNTPSQLLLKGAGRVFGAIPQNKSMLYNQYKKLIENEDYKDTVHSVISKYMLPFDVFEKGIERDLKLFFSQAERELAAKAAEGETEIKSKEKLLQIMREKPEIYRDAITLFEIRLRQYEWMLESEKEMKYV